MRQAHEVPPDLPEGMEFTELATGRLSVTPLAKKKENEDSLNKAKGRSQLIRSNEAGYFEETSVVAGPISQRKLNKRSFTRI